MKIIALEAENLKRIVAVSIKPDGNLVQITGKNGQGKTSVLDAIWWALAGKGNVQATPIRNGQERAVISLDLGDLKVTRTFNAKEDGSFTTSIKVENAEGARFQSPQKMLDDLLGQLTFDPLAFSRMSNTDKVQALRSLVDDYDFAAAEIAHKADFEERAIQNRKAKDAQAVADTLSRELPETIPEPINAEAELEALEAGISANDNRKAILHRRETLRAHIQTTAKQIKALNADLSAYEEDLAEAVNTPELIDLEPIREKIGNAKLVNEIATKAAERNEQAAIAEKASDASKALTARIADRKQEAQDAIANADLPIDAIEIIDGQVLLDGVPFEQASDAEQLSASIGIAMTLNPTLKVIRVRDGSLLDEDAMKVLAQMADDNDYQIWVERVGDTGTVGFVLEDGHIKGQELDLGEVA